jgi:hypothetical protein
MPGGEGHRTQVPVDHAEHRHGVHENGGLGIPGEDELLVRSLPHQGRERGTQQVVRFFEGLPCLGKGLGQFPTHADELGALTGKEKGE